MSRDHDEDGIIGARRRSNPADQTAGLGLFDAAAQVAEAEAQLRREFVAPPGPAAREAEQSDVFHGTLGGMTEAERQQRIARIKAAVRQPLIDRALLRRDIPSTQKPGVTAQDAREIAASKGLAHLLGDQQRAWSWLANWLQQLAREGELVRFEVEGTPIRRIADNGNDQVVYLHPYDRRAKRAGVA